MNELELTILSLVAEGPRYGSELERLIHERGLRNWLTVGSSSVYYILSKLKRQELLSSQVGTEPGNQLVYVLTEAGRGVLQTAITDLLRQPRWLGNGFELGLANLGALKPGQVYQALVQHEANLRQNIQATETLWQQEETVANDSARALYSHGLSIMLAELAWLTAFIDDWRMRYPAVEQEVKSDGDDPQSAPTEIHRSTNVSNPAKQIQRFRRSRE